METQQLEKVHILLKNGPVNAEAMWAEPIGDVLFQLKSIPFYAEGYAENDILLCQDIKGWNEVVKVENHSGNGTIRIMFSNSESNEATNILEQLMSVGCTFERASTSLVGVTVPSTLEIPFSQLANYLNGISDRILNGWEIGKRITRSPK